MRIGWLPQWRGVGRHIENGRGQRNQACKPQKFPWRDGQAGNRNCGKVLEFANHERCEQTPQDRVSNRNKARPWPPVHDVFRT
jgi:hypothetical protein